MEILWGILLPLLGFVYLAYAKVTKRVIPLLGGVSLIFAPYLSDNTYLLSFLLVAVVLGSYFLSW